MKKYIALLTVFLLVLSPAAALAGGTVAGGWSVADSVGITEENLAVFDKAMDALVGVNYEPVAYLGSQVVAGLNHCFLCRATVVYPDAEPYLALVYIYEDLSGGAEITNIARLDIAELSVPVELAEE